jgi:hypothetical protein
MGLILSLPEYRFTEVDNFVYQTEAEPWTGKPVQASDRDAVPVAWTASQLAAYREYEAGVTITEDDFLADPDFTLVEPAVSWGRRGTPILLPKVTLLNALASISPYKEAFDDIAEQLAAMNVLVARGTDYESDPDAPFHMALPHAEEYEAVDSHPDGGDFSYFVPVPEADKWQGGEVLYISVCTVLSVGNAPFINAYDDGAGGYLTFLHQNHIDKWSEVIQAGFPRYERVRYHVVFNMADLSADPNWGSIQPAFRSAVEDVCNTLAPYGVTFTTIYPEDDDAAKADIASVVSDFWGL